MTSIVDMFYLNCRMEDIGIKVPVQAELLTDGETGVQVSKSIGIPNMNCSLPAGEMIPQ